MSAVSVAPLGIALWQWLLLVLGAPFALLVGWILGRVVLAGLRRVAARAGCAGDDALAARARRPLGLLFALAVWSVLVPIARLPAAADHVIVVLERSAFIALAAWLLVGLIGLGTGLAAAACAAGASDEIRARAVRTQMDFAHRLASVVVVVLALALILMQFTVVRTVGVSLLASAGLATVVVGLAAQKSLGALLAGIQLSVTQPIRIGDQVLLEGESGEVEEITLTYVVVRIRDLRRLVVPITYFLDKPFQNWTRTGTELVGTVDVFAGYGVPVEQVRAELERVVRASEQWDGRLCELQVADATEKTVKLHAVVSSADPDRNWDLRCRVREALLAFLQGLEGGKFLPPG